MKAIALAALLLQVQPQDPHPTFLVLEEEPAVEHPEAWWIGYPSKRLKAIEKDVEEHVSKVRAADGKADVDYLEELRFIGRAHSRENVATKNTNGHLSKHFGYVAERAATLYGWSPTEWVLPSDSFSAGYKLADNGGATPEMTGEGWVERGWMTSPPHRAAILMPGIRFSGMGMGGTKDFTVAHLVFASLPKGTFHKLQDLQPLYQELARAKKAEVKEILEKILQKAEGSSFIRIAPLLRDGDRDVRLAAVAALKKLHEVAPSAKGPLFALIDFGVQSPSQDTALESAKALKALTGESHTTAKAWADWWRTSWKTYKPAGIPAPEEVKAPPAPAVLIKDQELSKKLALLENWNTEKGQWSQERKGEGIRGSGDSTMRFKEQLPKDLRLEFTLNVVDGMRPRMLFEGCGFFFGNEGFEKHFYVYGNGARELKGGRIPYVNERPVSIRVDMWGEDFSFWVDGKLCATGKRAVPQDGIRIAFRGGDDWSKGTCIYSKFALSTKPAK